MSDALRRGAQGGKVLVATLLAVGTVLVLSRLVVELYVEALWFASEGYLAVWGTRLLWLWIIRLGVAVLVAGLMAVNLRVVAGTLAGVRIKRRFGNLEIAEQLPQSYVRWTIAAAAGLSGLWFGASVTPGSEMGVLLLLNAEAWGSVDPFLGRDLGFHVFVVPALTAGVTFLLLVAAFLFLTTAGAYGATGSLRVVRGRVEMGPIPRGHLAWVGAGFLVMLAVRFWLARYQLLLDGNSGVQGIFGYSDHRARMPTLQALSVLTFVAAFLLVRGGRRGRMAPALAGVAAIAVGSVLLAEGYPALVQRFQVEPNELVRETPYIEANLDATRAGFGLDDLERRAFASNPATGETWNRGEEVLSAVPIWTREALLTGLRQTEARFRYYDFHEVGMTWYADASGGQVPVAVAVREVDPAGIEDPNWQNRHLRARYLAGMGAVALRANGLDRGGRPEMLLFNIPPEEVSDDVPPGVSLERPAVYVGTRPQLYAFVDPNAEGFRTASGDPGVAGVDFPTGIQVSSALRRLALAWRFQDANILFSNEVNSDSRFVHRRQVHSRVQAVAPFLSFPEAPFPVLDEGRVLWIVEGYSTSPHFPLSTRQSWVGREGATWVRNSVKVVVDGVTGEMAFYRTAEMDPLADALSRAFPALFQPLAEAPESVRAHLRYPRVLMELQSRVLTLYHQQTAPLFHGQQDRWSVATELATGTQQVPYNPEYALLPVPGEEEASFVLTNLLVPVGRQNLAAFLMGRWDAEGRNELILFDVPVDQQIAGPRQVEALVEQDPDISQQFSLWRQSGSQVWTGHLYLVPVGESLLYMEPIYLAANAEAIPEIRRFVVSDGRRVIMAPSLSGALQSLAAGQRTAVVEGDAEAEVTGIPELPAALATPSLRALELLDRAEELLRAGDWAGFGDALRALRQELEQPASGGGGGG
ncbi:MAG: UPF0182 family protein [Gemmatimonadota bacterium]